MYSEDHRKEKQRDAVRRYRERHAERLKAEREQLKAGPHEEIKAYWREKTARNRKDNREGTRKLEAKWYHTAKDKAFELLGNKCAMPHLEGDPLAIDRRCLQVDHIEAIGDAERCRLNHRGTKLYREVLKTPEKFQLLCASHNWIKRFEQNEGKQKSDSSSTTSARLIDGAGTKE